MGTWTGPTAPPCRFRSATFARYQFRGGPEGRLGAEHPHVLLDRLGVDAGEHAAQQGVVVGEEGVLGVGLHEHVEVGRRGDLARVGVVQHPRERVRVGHRHRVRGDDAVARGDRHPPRHRRPPVVADDVEAVGADGVGEADDVADEEGQREVLDACRPRPGRVAALVGGHRTEPRVAEGAELMPPLVGRLGEPVEEDDDLTVVRSRPSARRR